VAGLFEAGGVTGRLVDDVPKGERRFDGGLAVAIIAADPGLSGNRGDDPGLGMRGNL
jgi:hypothetical protein